MLQRSRQIVAITEIKIAIQIDIRKHTQVTLFQWMRLFHSRLTNTNHHSIFDGVNDVFIDYAAFGAFCHQNHVIALHETYEAQHTVCTDFLQ